jgi:hypothetical protein
VLRGPLLVGDQQQEVGASHRRATLCVAAG